MKTTRRACRKFFPWLMSVVCAGALAITPGMGQNSPARTIPVAQQAEAIPALNTAFPVAGKVQPRPAAKISASRWSVGGETLDRDYTSYEAYRKYLGPLGVKRIRLQGGWARTEREKGKYDWAWLDTVIDDAIAQGIRPWLQPSYGNPIYEGGGTAALAGGIPTSEEALRAWDAWVRAMVQRYKNRITEWEVWNEPDISQHFTAEDFARFHVRTADIIRQEQPNAKIIALAIAGVGRTEYVDTFLSYLKAQNKLSLVNAISYHGYTPRPEDNFNGLDKLQATVANYYPTMEYWQGENGAPSTPLGTAVGALRQYDWSEQTQAKWVLRRMFSDMGRDIAVTNVFQISDMHYAQGDHMSGLNSKGLLRANPDNTIAYAKPSYFAVQHVTAIFDESVERIKDFRGRSDQENMSLHAYRKKNNNSPIVALWFDAAKPEDNYPEKATKITVPDAQFKNPVVVDMLRGTVHTIPKANWQQQGNTHTFTNLPAYDSPILITDRSLIN
jgi:hypothetical protein